MKKDSITIINDFLKKNKIEINPEKYLKNFIVKSRDLNELPEDIVEKIISDAYNSSNELVKIISNFFIDKYDIFLGRIQKNQLKKYLDYRYSDDFEIFLELIKQDIDRKIDFKKIIDEIIKKLEYSITNSVESFNDNLKKAILRRDSERVTDYLIFLYSRLIGFNEKRNLSLKEIFDENEYIIKKELTDFDYSQLKRYCSNSKELDRRVAVLKFNERYIEILEHNGDYKQKDAVIYINIGQDFFNKFDSKEKFYNYMFNIIQKSYQKIQNHKTLIFHISTIIDEGINITWAIYAYLTIFAEKFLKIDKKFFYKPYEICIDVLEHKYSFKLTEEEKNFIENYYYFKNKEKIKFKDFPRLNNKEIKNTINFFEGYNHGFTFRDLFVLVNNNKQKNSEEIEFIKNRSELLLIFNKHQIDARKIPCPICASLKISGNSYPELGIRSWECKNPLCLERSKTNRGKRYSERTILMQNATFDFSKANQISKSMVNKWRRDVVFNWNEKELCQMIVKFFSFVGDKISVINPHDAALFKQIIHEEKRIPNIIEFEDLLNKKEIDEKLYYNFIEKNDFFKMFLYKKEIDHTDERDFSFIKDNDLSVKFIEGDSFYILDKMANQEVYVDNMVTSPPYYNAREYSNWKNLFNYLNDMYNISLKSYNVLKDGCVFFYNIGDIFDNENIVIKSKMGEKRIPLGAYTILFFKKAGFQLLDNIVWFKGEPQSSRHKNDGNYVPYYQKPANCYEHMFIFKKKGTIRLNKNKKENKLKENIIQFTPVYKIGAGGENRYGHSAPFPKTIPELSITCFTNEENIVLDPFSGSGTVPINAGFLNRVGIGIEINKEFVELSRKRAKERLLQCAII